MTRAKAITTSLALACLLLVRFAGTAAADEGMWLFSDLPLEYLKSRYDFVPSEAWTKHVMLSSVRFNSGGSASFVSSRGLVLTNHHVASDTLQKLSTPEHDYLTDGFLAKTWQDELKAPDLELNQLVSIEDVTERVNAAVKERMSTSDAVLARRAVRAEIEKESLEATGLRSDVITLFGGARYHLYRYRKYTDVRLVSASERKAAFFGGDADNFEYPRYCLDATLMRVYEDGKPIQIDHFLKYSAAGAADGELVFVSGNPGRTQRQFTVAALKYLRDHRMPERLDLIRRLEILLQQYALGGKEQERRSRDELLGIQNARKAFSGMLAGLQNPAFLAARRERETELLNQLRADPKLSGYADAWATIAELQEQKEEQSKQAPPRLMSRYFNLAYSLVMLAEEDAKPNSERFPEYRDSSRASLEQQLFSPAPIYDDLETAKLADGLAAYAEERGGDDPVVVKVLAEKSPTARAAALIGNTQLGDVAFRRRFAEGGMGAIESSEDPMIRLARLLVPEFRRARKTREELAEAERQAYAKITEATIALEGTSSYPDATFTLRLAFGPVKGYEEGGKSIPPWTDFAGAFEHEQRHGAAGDWVLPQSYHEHKADLDLSAPLNFVCTADIIGGNSGSPVINRAGELVGLIFDGNIQSLTADYFYSDEVARAVAVHSAGIREALRAIYQAEALADELGQ